MSFFDKMKQSATEAARKAQQTVEVTRLKAQISSREKEIEKVYTQIGEAVFLAYAAGDTAQSESEVTALCERVKSIRDDIAELERRIKFIRMEKTCECGRVVGMDVKFCPDCGRRFPDEPVFEEPRIIICSSCHADNEPNSKFCAFCGSDLTGGNVREPEDARVYLEEPAAAESDQGSSQAGPGEWQEDGEPVRASGDTRPGTEVPAGHADARPGGGSERAAEQSRPTFGWSDETAAGESGPAQGSISTSRYKEVYYRETFQRPESYVLDEDDGQPSQAGPDEREREVPLDRRHGQGSGKPGDDSR